jgi:hypothetical protein
MRSAFFLLLAGFVSLAGVSSTAFAQSSDALIREGLALRREGRDAEALDRFERAYSASQSPQALAQMALAEQALGRFVVAEVHLTEAMARRDDRWIATRTGQLQQALASIQAQLGTIELSGGTGGAEVYVDGELRGTMPGANILRVRAGSVALEVRAAGYLPVQRPVNVAAGGTVRETILLVAVADPGTPPQPQDPIVQPVQPSGGGGAHPDWVLFGIGVGLFGLAWVVEWGTTIGVGGDGEFLAISFIPVAGPFILAGDSSELFSILNIIDGLAQVAGIVLAILGLVLTVEDSPSARLDTPSFAVLPWAGPSGAGLQGALTF